MSCFAPPLADAGDLLTVLVGILFVIVAVVGQLYAKWKEAQQAGQRPPQPGPGPGEKAGPLEDEIGEFLRDAARRVTGRRVPPAGGPQPPGGPRPPKPPPPPPIQAPVEAEVVQRQLGQLRESLEERKPRTLGSELGTEVAQADDKIADRLHDVFDHRVSSLAGTPGDSAVQSSIQEAASPEDQITALPSTAAAGLAALFADADSIRQAIVINEVLQRPEHRWS